MIERNMEIGQSFGTVIVLLALLFGIWLWAIRAYPNLRMPPKSQKAIGSGNLERFESTLFSGRARAISIAKGRWVITLTLVVIASLLFAMSLIVAGVGQSETDLWLRLAAAPPFIFAISFCAFQYARERRLEEEYVFRGEVWAALTVKSNSDLSEVGSPTPALSSELRLVAAMSNGLFASPVAPSGRNSQKHLIKTVDNLKDLTKSLRDVTETLSKLPET